MKKIVFLLFSNLNLIIGLFLISLTIYLERYFGDNESIRNFVKTLIKNKQKEALKELNKIINVLGIDKDFKKTNEVIKIRINT